jgi:hypothetical protein
MTGRNGPSECPPRRPASREGGSAVGIIPAKAGSIHHYARRQVWLTASQSYLNLAAELVRTIPASSGPWMVVVRNILLDEAALTSYLA